MTASEYIFVYGTLRRGFCNPVQQTLERCANFVSGAVLNGKLYEIEGYPGAVLSDDQCDLVIGELYKIKNRDKIFSVLDEYEGCSQQFPEPREYIRKPVTVWLENGEGLMAWTYLYNWQINDKAHIRSGDYLKWRQQQDER